MSKLYIGDTASGRFCADADLVTQCVSIVGRRGSGKTYTAAVCVEELLGIGAQVVVIDPLDVWWGLRSGFPIVIFGGDHADLPLRETDGKTIADAVVEHRFSCVLSVSHLSRNKQKAFVGDFAERLFHRKHETALRTPLHLAVDEADEFAPQRPMPGEQRMLGAMEALVRRGRSRGIGTTLISQRPAVLNKDVLTQTELMIAHQLTGPHDKKQVQAWVEAHDEGKRGTEFMRSIVELPKGEAWFWSPVWLNVFARVKVRKRKTFDSSFTPKAGAKPNTPKTLSEVDLVALKAKLANTIKQAEANDPAKLKKRIAELERELRVAQQATGGVSQADLDEAVKHAEQQFLIRLGELKSDIETAIQERFARDISAAFGVNRPIPRAKPLPTPVPARTATPKRAVSSALDTSMGKCERAILSVLYKFDACTKKKTALMSGYSARSGSFANSLSKLRQAGYMEGSGAIAITAAGRAALPDPEPLPEPGDPLIRYWLSRLGKCAAEILDVLIGAHPKGLSKHEIAERTASRYSATSGSFANSLSELRTLELITGSGDNIRASGELLGEETR